MAGAVSLDQMVDLAIGPPETGAVNFNILKAVLLALIRKSDLDITVPSADIYKISKLPQSHHYENVNRDPSQINQSRGPEGSTDPQLSASLDVIGGVADSDTTITSRPSDVGFVGGSKSSVNVPVARSKSAEENIKKHPSDQVLETLEKKVSHIENQLNDINNGVDASNAQLFERVKSHRRMSSVLGNPEEETELRRPVSEMWQLMQLTKRVAANDEGIGKLMSLSEDMMARLGELQDNGESLKTQLTQHAENISDVKTDVHTIVESAVEEKMGDFVSKLDLQSVLVEARDITQETAEKPIQMYPKPHHPDVEGGCLPGETELKIEELSTMQNDLLIKVNGITERLENQTSHSESVDLNNLLEQMGAIHQEINDLHALKDQFAELQDLITQYQHDTMSMRNELETIANLHTQPDEGLPVNSDQQVAEAMSISLMEQETAAMKAMGETLNGQFTEYKIRLESVETKLKLTLEVLEEKSAAAIQYGSEVDQSAQIVEAHDAVETLQADVAKLGGAVDALMSEHGVRQEQIQRLHGYVKQLQQSKADREVMSHEIETKADKSHLGLKVSRSTFEERTTALSEGIAAMLDKLTGQERDWQQAVDEMSDVIGQKLEKTDIRPLEEYMEKKIHQFDQQVTSLTDYQAGTLADEAAGIRKQLYNCISCDKRVKTASTAPLASLPIQDGLPATRSTRPYTTFELDHLRQCMKSPAKRCLTGEYSIMNRACGGAHTMLYPHKRNMKTSGCLPDESDNIPIVSGEVELIGLDGHIYKGRQNSMHTLVLPSISSGKGKQERKAVRRCHSHELSMRPGAQLDPRASPESCLAPPDSNESKRSYSPSPPLSAISGAVVPRVSTSEKDMQIALRDSNESSENETSASPKPADET
ncbi:PREDICTED: glutamine-rich protein 2-like [Priapulus caudatus]|uniref:Glutamine-rich protein 2-like n=1 Tax=Priapulus caudatus TaxID=37621 RepID=A0ABM1EYC4_PRICU|nr:PREDICTED: glutamine-rich protein 2-like [Priapulus caudatus]